MRERLAYLDGMRGVAAMMVFTIHSGAPAIRALGPLGNSLVDHGRYGVTVFFVVSAFALFMSLTPFSAEEISWRSYFIRRFFRIAPLYYVVLTTLLIAFPRPEEAITAIYHYTFANAIAPQFANDIIGVEWSIEVESAFYLLLPVIVALCRWRFGLFALSTVSFVLLEHNSEITHSLGDTFFAGRNYSLVSHLYAFAIGITAYVFLTRRWIGVNGRRALIALSAGCMLTMIFRGEIYWTGLMIAVLTASAIVCADAGGMAKSLLSWSPLVYVGKISFSIYLLHTLVLGMAPTLHWEPNIAAATALLATIILATFTYHLVEVPGRALGKKLERIMIRQTQSPEAPNHQPSVAGGPTEKYVQ
jgi:peptidoglycan/LPS O-acetylase OafA/YrhL